MDNQNVLTLDQKIDKVNEVEDLAVIKSAATDLGLTYSGNTGIKSLKVKVIEALRAAEVPDISTPVPDTDIEDTVLTDLPKVPEVPTTVNDGPPNDAPSELDNVPVIPKKTKAKKGLLTNADLMLMDPNNISDPILCRRVVRAHALRISRVRIVNLDPADSQLSGGIITVVGKYIGKQSKYVPFGEESDEGYHITQCLLDRLKEMKFAMRKEIKGGQFGVKKYRTVMANKFSIEILPLLTKKELDAMASRQAAAGTISKD